MTDLNHDSDSTIRVMIVDDNPVVRSGLIALLEIDDGIEVIAEAGDGRRAVQLADHLTPDLVLLDVRMPLVDGIEAAGQLSDKTRVLMLSYTEDPDVVRSAIRSGAIGYLVHGAFTAEELVAAVHGAADGTVHPLSPVAVGAVIAGVRDESAVAGSPTGDDTKLRRAVFGLSNREAEVMNLLAQGLTNGEVAHDLFLSEKTVKNHVNRIYAKLGAPTRGAAIAAWRGPLDAARPKEAK